MVPFVRLVLFAFLVFAAASQGSGSSTDLLAIQEAVTAGDLDAASRQIEASLSVHPRDGGLLNLRGVVHAQRNELQQAHQDFAEAVRFAPTLLPAWQNLARACRLEAQQSAAAVPCAMEASERVLRLKADDTEARTGLALLHEEQGHFAQSLRELDLLPAAEASQPAISLLRCGDLAAMGRTAEADRIASRLASDSQFSEADLASVQTAFGSPKAAPVLITLTAGLDVRHAAGLATLRKLAIAYEQVGHAKDARNTLERVAILDPNNAAHLLELARLADAAKDHEGAIGYLAHARDLAPNDPQIHFLFAKVATEMELPLEARASLEKALALAPENPAYNYAMGSVILSTRDAATAGHYFKKVVDALPQDPASHYALGIAYFAGGDYANAKVEMQRVENNPGTAGGAAYFLGRMARLEDDLDASIQYLRKSIALMPDYSESHTELARVFMLKRNLKQAQTELGRALSLDPRSFQANAQLLVLYKQTHDPQAEKQAAFLKELDEDRSKRAELMLRTIEVRP